MNKEKYTTFELSILFFIILNSYTSTIIISLFKSYNISEIIISLLLSFIIGIPIIIQLNKLYKNDHIEFIKNKKILKYIIVPILLLSTSVMGIISINKCSNIIKDVLLPNESLTIIIIPLVFISSFLAHKGLKPISIAANLLFIILIFIEIISISFNITNINTNNLLPLINTINKNNILELIVIINAPLFLTLLIPKNEITDYDKFKKNNIKTYIIFYIYLIIKILFLISILGDKYYELIKYPEISVLKSINIFNFFQRLEELLIINIFIENFILLSLITFYINSFIKNKSIKYITPLILLIISMNITEMNNNIILISNTVFIILNMFLYKKRYH